MMIDYDAFPEQRQSYIQQLLNKNGRVVSADLIKLLGVSEHTRSSRFTKTCARWDLQKSIWWCSQSFKTISKL